MTTKIDAMIAPRALTALEIASVIAPDAVIYATAHRAFIHTTILSDGDGDLGQDGATRYTAETALTAIGDRAIESISEWLSDMDGDGEPRFYRKGAVAEAVRLMLGNVAAAGMKCENDREFGAFLADLTDRTDRALDCLTGEASDPK